MKKIIFLFLTLITSQIAFAQYKPVDQGSVVKFKIQNFGFDVTGSFKGLQGYINFVPQNGASHSFDITVDAGTINTDNTMRDKHLQEETYFDVKNYPRIHFVSKKVGVANKDGVYTVSGTLTIKGKSRDISFPFTVQHSGDDMYFKGSFKINRRDFGIGGISAISNELEVSLSVLSQKV